ncbi:hypothetical protein ABC337_04800 [Arthrobacter sp. 1P04PC]|uniref:hypothetical protein n=1 Tax=unclassified Arthrobacter TaxID=235627 RepID=UPI0039A2763F
MSDTATNTHVAMAKFRQEGLHEWQSQEGETEASILVEAIDGQIEATLALTYEQRTANLIAYQANVEASYAKAPLKPRSDNAQRLNQTIIERLDLA